MSSTPAEIRVDASSSPPPARHWLIALGLAVFTVAVYARVGWLDFTEYDDPQFVTDNSHVMQGLTWESVRWAFTSYEIDYYRPLSWLSHIVDWELYGDGPAGHHYTNVLIHTVNVVLLYVALRRMTGCAWRSAAVAALFACHPMRVESVAWVAERKDVLSAMFLLLTVLAYEWYARTPGAARYSIVLAAFILGLMSKPMLVTLPLLLLLLDYWPMRRWFAPGDAPTKYARCAWVRCVLEKLPLLVLAVACGLFTIYAQHQVGTLDDKVSLPVRMGNAVVSYGMYLSKLFLPIRMAVFYPYESPSAVGVTLCLLLLLTITVAGILFARSRPYLLMGWLWFGLGIGPVSGIIQVGQQAMADRYTYIPYMGLFIIIAWGAGEIVQRYRIPPRRVALAAGAILLVLSSITLIQIGYWKNQLTLFLHAIEVTEDNWLAHSLVSPQYVKLADSLGGADQQDDRNRLYDLAEMNAMASLRLRPNRAITNYNLANLYARFGRLDEAMHHYEIAVADRPEMAEAHHGIGVVWGKRGNFQRAIDAFEKALVLNSDLDVSRRMLELARDRAAARPATTQASDQPPG